MTQYQTEMSTVGRLVFLFSSVLRCLLDNMVEIRYFGACTNVALSANSQPENNQYLKIQETRNSK